MEQTQELRQLDRSVMATEMGDEGSRNEPEAWYKVVLDAATEEATRSPAHSEDEHYLSHGWTLAKSMRESKS